MTVGAVYILVVDEIKVSSTYCMCLCACYLQAVLQMSNQRVPLLGEEENEPLHQLDPAATINEVIQHEVKDIGTHM